jgi:hypothetical protein
METLVGFFAIFSASIFFDLTSPHIHIWIGWVV